MALTDFSPSRVQRCQPARHARPSPGGDSRDGRVYVYWEPEVALAVRVALATRRPILVHGPSGCGKSTLAQNVALSLKRRYYEHVVTQRTELTDVLWHFDAIRRLSDANRRTMKREVATYLEPRAMWWAFDPTSARRRGSLESLPGSEQAKDAYAGRTRSPAVLLIDEIDKADGDLPNALLVPLGSLEFALPYDLGVVRAQQPPLVFVTTNGERALPAAFVRRCIHLELRSPPEPQLIEIASAVIPEAAAAPDLLKHLAAETVRLFGSEASTAEYLDAVRACLALNIGIRDAAMEAVTKLVLEKGRGR